MIYKVEDRELYNSYMELKKKWEARSKELVEEMIASGVDKEYSEDGTGYIKLINMPEAKIPNYTRKGFSYIRYYWWKNYIKVIELIVGVLFGTRGIQPHSKRLIMEMVI